MPLTRELRGATACEVMRGSVGVALGFAGWSKLWSPSTATGRALGSVVGVGETLEWWVSALLPGVEVALSLFLLVGHSRRLTSSGATVLTSAFAAFHALRHFGVSWSAPMATKGGGCGCLGSLPGLSGPGELVAVLALAVMSIFVCIADHRREADRGHRARSGLA